MGTPLRLGALSGLLILLHDASAAGAAKMNVLHMVAVRPAGPAPPNLRSRVNVPRLGAP